MTAHVPPAYHGARAVNLASPGAPLRCAPSGDPRCAAVIRLKASGRGTSENTTACGASNREQGQGREPHG